MMMPGEMLLMVANFDDQPVSMDLTIPDHAYNYLEIQEKAYKAEDLLSGDMRSIVMIKGEPIQIELPARGAKVFKMKD